EEAGLTAKEVHEARKLRDAEKRTPGIVERVIEARLAAGLEPSRANLRAAVGTDSATAAERGNNLYETPPEAVHTLL
ncbi:MAG: SAM-dependent methyltransferase, partial [Mesorhizobium sp.]